MFLNRKRIEWLEKQIVALNDRVRSLEYEAGTYKYQGGLMSIYDKEEVPVRRMIHLLYDHLGLEAVPVQATTVIKKVSPNG